MITRAGTGWRPKLERLNKKYFAEQRGAMLNQQPINTALGQLIAHQKHHVIESALPILTCQSHIPILLANRAKPAQARRNRAH
ncbi:MAG TPA: hypothetical protein VEI45_26200 [Mycobacterium sp.]|nr:hypothetical protein [Mycobacterium sp.]HXY67769.1 hypothetical protein [Mycobacterium sp.]